MTQYRVTTTKANLRNESHVMAGIVSVLEAGAIVHIDTDRTPDGDWLPVVLVRGWVHQSVVEAVE
jgi:hypothetical protein